MNLEEIKEIIKKDQGKFIIIEDGKPLMVILSFGDYQKILNLRSREREKSEKFVPIGETIQESKEDFISEPLPGESFSDEEDEGALPSDLFSEAERSPAGEAGSEAKEEAPSESEERRGEEPMKIEDLPF